MADKMENLGKFFRQLVGGEIDLKKEVLDRLDKFLNTAKVLPSDGEPYTEYQGENPRWITPTPTPTPTQTPTTTITPEEILAREQQARQQVLGTGYTPLLPEITQNYPDKVPYYDLIQKIWQGVDPNKVANTVYGESSFRPNLVHINDPLWETRIIENQQQLEDILAQYPSVDIGLMQINLSDPAKVEYLKQLGITPWDLIANPELNLRVAYDLYSGKIPNTAPGFSNWVAAQNLGY